MVVIELLNPLIRPHKIQEIILYGETILVNMFTEITTNVYSEVLQMFL